MADSRCSSCDERDDEGQVCEFHISAPNSAGLLLRLCSACRIMMQNACVRFDVYKDRTR